MNITYSQRIMQAIQAAMNARLPIIEDKLKRDPASGEGFGNPIVSIDLCFTPLPKRGKRVRRVLARVKTKWTEPEFSVEVELDDPNQEQLPMGDPEPTPQTPDPAEREDGFIDATPTP